MERTPAQSYVEDCLAYVIDQGARLAAAQGGYINPRGSLTYGDEGDHSPAQYHADGLQVSYGLVGNQLRLSSREEISARIARYALVELDDCIDPQAFTKQGYSLSKPHVVEHAADLTVPYAPGDLAVEAIIREDDIMANAHYPVLLERDKERVLIEDFTATVPLRLGRTHRMLEQLLRAAAGKEYRINEHCAALSAPDGRINIYLVPNIYRQDYLLRIVDAPLITERKAPLRLNTGVRNTAIRGECVG